MFFVVFLLDLYMYVRLAIILNTYGECDGCCFLWMDVFSAFAKYIH